MCLLIPFERQALASLTTLGLRRRRGGSPWLRRVAARPPTPPNNTHAPSHAWPHQADAARAWLTLSSSALAFAFVFGNSARGLYESALFLFGAHAFDVGDALLVGEAWHRVVGVALMHTQLERWDGVRIWHGEGRGESGRAQGAGPAL